MAEAPDIWPTTLDTAELSYPDETRERPLEEPFIEGVTPLLTDDARDLMRALYDLLELLLAQLDKGGADGPLVIKTVYFDAHTSFLFQLNACSGMSALGAIS